MRRTLPLAVGIALGLGPGAVPAAAQCPEPTPTYTSACGPTFVLPGWGDAGGWTNPEQYETIQLADVDGDGDDDLLARTPAGVAVHVFDKTLGQWRPQVDAQNLPVMLTAFASPPPLTTANPNRPATDWTLPQYYDTIQAADIDGDKRAEILGRSADGLIQFKFTPGAAPGQGSWGQLPDPGGSFAGAVWDDPSHYTTIQSGDFDGDGDAEVIGRQTSGVVGVRWTASGWTRIPDLNFLGDAASGNKPQYYTSLQAANVDGDSRQELVGRTVGGISVYKLRSGTWRLMNRFFSPFTDVTNEPDCPFTIPGQTCFDSGPAYYGTIQLADVNGNGREELLGRASDGVRALRYQGDAPDAWGRLQTLAALSDANGYTDQKYWETIQFADIDGDGRDEALARDKNGLNAWSYTRSSNAWTAMPANTPLQLSDAPWGSDRSYYSTIQTGDVDGDRQADVVARGPYGIRTWFYRGGTGWARYQTEGYAAFTGTQKAAFDSLNQQAHAQNVIPASATTVRDIWASEEAPGADVLQTKLTEIVALGTCTGLPPGSVPPRYATCTPPAGSSGFSADDWTLVLNKIIAELYWARPVVQHFADVQSVREALFLEQSGQLPDISQQLAGAAGLDADFNPNEILSGMFGIMGVLAGAADSEIAIPLQIGAEILSMLPSSSKTLATSFEGTVQDLQTKFNNSIIEINNALAAHSQLVRQDEGLLTLVGQLRDRGTWTTKSGVIDSVGMKSAGRQGYALSIYKTLLPLIWARYVITGCVAHSLDISCTGPPPGPWFTGSSANFTAIGPMPTLQSPCYTPVGSPNVTCQFDAPPNDVAGIVWSQVSPNCTYQPPNAQNTWTFVPQCSLGVDPAETLADPATMSATRRWTFKSFTGDPTLPPPGAAQLSGSATGIDADAPSVASAGANRRGGAVVAIRGSTAMPRAPRLQRARRVVFDRLLFERHGAGELVRHWSGRRVPPLILSRRGGAAGAGLFATRRTGDPHVRLRLRRRGPRLLRFRLVARNITLPNPPAACGGTRPGVDLATSPISLHTRLRIDDGRQRPVPISLEAQWRCRRNRLGAVRRLVLRPTAYRAPRRRSLRLRIRGPRRLAPGRLATYRIGVGNRRPTTAYDVMVRTAVPRGFRLRRARGARVGGGQIVWRRRALTPGSELGERLRVRAPRSAAGRRCSTVVSHATDTRASRKRFCILVRRADRR